jgi:hypothetical protein
VSLALDHQILESVQNDANRFTTDERLTTIARLLVHSHKTKGNDLQSFIEVWAALEVFVNGLFKDQYEQEWLKRLADGTPPSAQRYFARLKEVMKDKYRLIDKFVVIASLLNDDAAEADGAAVKRIKDVRDTLHTGKIAGMNLPVHEAQKLLRKYLRLHMVHCGDNVNAASAA